MSEQNSNFKVTPSNKDSSKPVVKNGNITPQKVVRGKGCGCGRNKKG